jgi:chromosome segregation ATPase
MNIENELPLHIWAHVHWHSLLGLTTSRDGFELNSENYKKNQEANINATIKEYERRRGLDGLSLVPENKRLRDTIDELKNEIDSWKSDCESRQRMIETINSHTARNLEKISYLERELSIVRQERDELIIRIQ